MEVHVVNHSCIETLATSLWMDVEVIVFLECFSL